MDENLLEKGKAHAQKGEVDQAIQCLSEYLNGDFFNEEALFMLGACLQSKGMNGLSAVLTSAAIDARAQRGKTFPEALMNLGSAYKAEHRNKTAERIWRDGLARESVPTERSKFYTNLSGLYINEGAPEIGLEYCDLALEENPNNAGARLNRGLAALELGRWEEGFRDMLAGYKTGDRTSRHYPGIPEWDGAPGKRVIIWGDQGVGDEILFASCLREAISQCHSVIFDCHPRLEATFRRSFPDIEVYGTRKNLTGLPWLEGCKAEAAYNLSDLPVLYRKRDADFPGVPYLIPDADTVARLRKGARNLPRIGISWTGGTKKTRSDLRSIPLTTFRPLLQAVEADWFSLQYTDAAAREVCELEEETGIRIAHFPGWVECRDYDRTMAFIASMDLIITVCTTAYHAAGSMGVPVWCLVPSKPAWRYASRENLWYGSARFFRQQPDEDWEPVIARVARELVAKYERMAA